MSLHHEVILNTKTSEFDEVWALVNKSRKSKTVTISKKILERFLMDHSKMVDKLQTLGAEFKDPKKFL